MATKDELLIENRVLKEVAGKNRAIGINVGPSKETVDAARDGIASILESGQEQKTLRVALRSFHAICSVNNAHVSGCSVHVNRETEE